VFAPGRVPGCHRPFRKGDCDAHSAQSEPPGRRTTVRSRPGVALREPA
jgi:hypothetical protein